MFLYAKSDDSALQQKRSDDAMINKGCFQRLVSAFKTARHQLTSRVTLPNAGMDTGLIRNGRCHNKALFQFRQARLACASLSFTGSRGLKHAWLSQASPPVCMV
jgi:hypothetical protein